MAHQVIDATCVRKGNGASNEGTKKQPRKPRFTEKASNIIVDNVLPHFDVLLGHKVRSVSAQHRRKIWEDIATKVNAVSATKRSAADCKKRWYDIRKSVRSKYVLARSEARKTGGGEPPKLELTTAEARVAETMDPASLEGVGGVNSTLEDSEEVQSGVINTIAKLTKACTLRLTVSKLYFILTDKVANGGVSMWCELSQGNFFDEFQMEGVSAEHNDIYLELTPENLSRALKTAQNAKAVKIKLTSKHCPCLTVAVELPSLSNASRIVTHDIPVGVIPRKLWHDFREPNVPDFDVSIYLPVLKTMKSIVERMKNLSNFVVIEANRNGEMNLKIETDLVSVSTHFKDLGNPPWIADDVSQASSQDRDPEEMAEARVDIRKLLQFLAGQQVNPTKAICNIVNKRIVHFILLHEDVSLQYFIPAIA